MPRHCRRDPIFRYRRHEDDLVVLCVRWYISYRLSLRDLTEMMAERGLDLYPSTIWRWVQRFVPEFEKRWDRLRRPTGSSWRLDETYVQIRGKWFYLYRAVDKQGRTIDFLLRPDRGIAAAQAFFRKAVATNRSHGPRKVTLDGHVPSRRALWLLRREALFWRHVEVRTNRYLNNIVEQDHRAIKRRCAAMHGFKSASGCRGDHRRHRAGSPHPETPISSGPRAWPSPALNVDCLKPGAVCHLTPHVCLKVRCTPRCPLPQQIRNQLAGEYRRYEGMVRQPQPSPMDCLQQVARKPLGASHAATADRVGGWRWQAPFSVRDRSAWLRRGGPQGPRRLPGTNLHAAGDR